MSNYVDKYQAAEIMLCSPATWIAKLSKHPKAPKPLKTGRRYRWPTAELEQFRDFLRR